MDNEINKKAARGFADAFAASFAESLTQAVASPAALKVLENPDLATRQGQPVHLRLTVEGAVRGECFIECYQPQVAELASMILRRPLAPFSEEDVQALERVISAAVESLTASLSVQYGKLAFKVDRAADLAFGGMLLVPLSVSVKEQSAIPLHLYFDAEFLAALSSQLLKKSATEKAPIDPLNLKLVMDVELNVSLRFGHCQMPLREVLELASGSVVELDRQVDDPIELLLDGKVLARGEAVIVDGHYGLRVTEVPQPIATHLNC